MGIITIYCKKNRKIYKILYLFLEKYKNFLYYSIIFSNMFNVYTIISYKMLNITKGIFILSKEEKYGILKDTYICKIFKVYWHA